MAKSIELGKDLEYQTLKALAENDGELVKSQLMDILKQRVNLDNWAKATLEKSGYIRWESILQFYSIELVKAGFITKNRKNATWYITEEGKKVLSLGKEKVFELAHEKYKQWEEKTISDDNCNIADTEVSDEQIEKSLQKSTNIIEEAKSKSYEVFQRYILQKFDPYSFQDLCAALFRGMGYYTPLVAPKGKDGGVDIIAYKDPIGSTTPHVKIQVKYRQETKASAPEIQQLKGTLRDGDIGVFISLAGFSSDAEKEVRAQNAHIELIDLKRLIELWTEFYDKMDDEDKALMQIAPVYFITKD